jgi:hypothetical protein
MSGQGRAVYVSRFSSWAPGLSGGADWQEWARGKKEIAISSDAPALAFTEPLFRRRLSQISKMTIQVLHEIMGAAEQAKIVFVSFRGEIGQQFKINRMLAAEGGIGPAAFSHSVFNTPPALAAIALGLCGGYSAVYPAGGCFATGFLAAAAPLLAQCAGKIAFVYADELCPPEYGCSRAEAPLAFAALLEAAGEGIPVTLNSGALDSPRHFLKYLYLYGEQP